MKSKICLNCGVSFCVCGKNQWLEVAAPELPEPCFSTSDPLGRLTFCKAIALHELIKTGKMGEYNRIVLETILMVMGYDNDQQTPILSLWRFWTRCR